MAQNQTWMVALMAAAQSSRAAAEPVNAREAEELLPGRSNRRTIEERVDKIEAALGNQVRW
jgi:hypothetical protein